MSMPRAATSVQIKNQERPARKRSRLASRSALERSPCRTTQIDAGSACPPATRSRSSLWTTSHPS